MTVAETMRRATAAYGRGDFAGALSVAEQARRSAPANPAVLEFIGVVLCRAGRPAEGLTQLRAALALAPADANLRFNAARAALDLGDAALAAELNAPIASTADGQRLMAEIAKAADGPEQALAHYEAILARNPRDLAAHNNYGNALNSAGRTREAVEALRRALELAPNSAQVLLNLGRAEAAAGDHDAALAAFEAATQAKGDDAAIRLELGKSLVRHGNHEAALPQLSEAARLGERDAQVFLLIGVCFAALVQRDRAEQSFRMALHVEPGSARAFLNLAILLEQENRIDELRALADEMRAKAPAGADADYVEALILKRDGKFAEALELASRSESDSLDAVVRAQFIGEMADRVGLHAKAFAAYAEMNVLMGQTPEALRFGGAEHIEVIEARTKAITPQWFARWTDVPAPDTRPSPAFLGGFLRSGTTLLDTILMGHPGAHVREEEAMIAELEAAAGDVATLPGKDAAGIARMRDAYFAEVLRGGPLPAGKLLVDKYPLMTLRASYVHRAFPDARFVFALRHPCDVVLSCWMQNFRVTRAMASFLTLENAARLYDAAMTHWMHCRQVMPLSVHTVRYEDMVEDLEGQLRPLLDFLGLGWDDKLLDHQQTARQRGYIRTPSYAQVTEGIYRRSRGRWENYRSEMAPVLDVLAPWAIRFGYEDPREI